MKKIAFIDLETSGINAETSEIIAFYAMIDDVKVTFYTKYAKPKTPLTLCIQELTGITNQCVEKCRPSSEVKAEFLKLIEGAFIVGRNIPFLESFLGVTFTDKLDLFDYSKCKITKRRFKNGHKNGNQKVFKYQHFRRLADKR